MILKIKQSVNIFPTQPFNFDATFHKPDHFTSGDNIWQPGFRLQTWTWKRKRLGLKFINKGHVNKPKILLEIYSNNSLEASFVNSLVQEIIYRYNLQLDLTDFYNKFKKDNKLGPIITKWKGLRPGHQSSLYEYLIIGIVLQNATVRRSVQMFSALQENYGTLIEYAGHKLWCFWKPGRLAEVSQEELRSLKVGYRANSSKKLNTLPIKKLSRKICENKV